MKRHSDGDQFYKKAMQTFGEGKIENVAIIRSGYSCQDAIAVSYTCTRGMQFSKKLPLSTSIEEVSQARNLYPHLGNE